MKENIRYGLHIPTGEEIHITQSRRGMQCDCICQGCGKELEACQGDSVEWYFRHKKKSDCKGGQETAIHKFAKQIILENREIEIHTGRINYTNAIEEEKIGVFIADAVVESNQEKVYFEIKVTHEVDFVKKLYYKAQGIKCIEIDLGKVSYATSPEELKHLVLDKKDNRNKISWTKEEGQINYRVYFAFFVLACGFLYYLFRPKEIRSIRYKRRRY